MTGELTARQLADELGEVVRVLRDLGVAEVRVEHWEGQGPVAISDLPALLEAEDSPTGKLQPWTGLRCINDFDIYEDSHTIHFQFCHHDELHVRCQIPELKARFWNRWEALGYGGRWRDDPDEE